MIPGTRSVLFVSIHPQDFKTNLRCARKHAAVPAAAGEASGDRLMLKVLVLSSFRVQGQILTRWMSILVQDSSL